MSEKAFEVIKEYIEKKDTGKILECLNQIEHLAILIGDGKSAEIFSVPEGDYMQVCLKKIKKTPEVKGNDIDTEFEHQNSVASLGVRVPLTIARIKNKVTNEEYLIMERILGPDIEQVISFEKELPKGYDHKSFWEKVKKYVNIMHESDYYHCDLHSKNIMIDKDGSPVIIDFGVSNYGAPGEDYPYKKYTGVYNKVTNRYDWAWRNLWDDELMIIESKTRMLRFLNPELIDKK
jgi:RIO-like serine/threonine protein kinase